MNREKAKLLKARVLAAFMAKDSTMLKMIEAEACHDMNNQEFEAYLLGQRVKWCKIKFEEMNTK